MLFFVKSTFVLLKPALLLKKQTKTKTKKNYCHTFHDFCLRFRDVWLCSPWTAKKHKVTSRGIIARGVMVIVIGNGHGDTSSNPGLIAFHIALIPLGKV